MATVRVFHTRHTRHLLLKELFSMTFRSKQHHLANELTNHKQNLKSLLQKLRMLAMKMPAVKFKTEPKKKKKKKVSKPSNCCQILLIWHVMDT